MVDRWAERSVEWRAVYSAAHLVETMAGLWEEWWAATLVGHWADLMVSMTVGRKEELWAATRADWRADLSGRRSVDLSAGRWADMSVAGSAATTAVHWAVKTAG